MAGNDYNPEPKWVNDPDASDAQHVEWLSLALDDFNIDSFIKDSFPHLADNVDDYEDDGDGTTFEEIKDSLAAHLTPLYADIADENGIYDVELEAGDIIGKDANDVMNDIMNYAKKNGWYIDTQNEMIRHPRTEDEISMGKETGANMREENKFVVGEHVVVADKFNVVRESNGDTVVVEDEQGNRQTVSTDEISKIETKVPEAKIFEEWINDFDIDSIVDKIFESSDVRLKYVDGEEVNEDIQSGIEYDATGNVAIANELSVELKADTYRKEGDKSRVNGVLHVTTDEGVETLSILVRFKEVDEDEVDDIDILSVSTRESIKDNIDSNDNIDVEDFYTVLIIQLLDIVDTGEAVTEDVDVDIEFSLNDIDFADTVEFNLEPSTYNKKESYMNGKATIFSGEESVVRPVRVYFLTKEEDGELGVKVSDVFDVRTRESIMANLEANDDFENIIESLIIEIFDSIDASIETLGEDAGFDAPATHVDVYVDIKNREARLLKANVVIFYGDKTKSYPVRIVNGGDSIGSVIDVATKKDLLTVLDPDTSALVKDAVEKELQLSEGVVLGGDKSDKMIDKIKKSDND